MVAKGAQAQLCGHLPTLVCLVIILDMRPDLQPSHLLLPLLGILSSDIHMAHFLFKLHFPYSVCVHVCVWWGLRQTHIRACLDVRGQ